MPDLIAVLAEPNRRRLLELLASGELSAGELASHFGVTRPAISQHLGVLTAAGLVTARRDGRFRYYRLDAAGMAQLREALDHFWTNELDLLVAAANARKDAETVTIDKTVVVPLDPDATFALLTEPDRIRRWQALTARVDLRAGGSYRFAVTPGHVAAGTYREVEPGRRVVLTWGWEGDDVLPPGGSVITITLEPVAGGTQVHLVHEGLTAEQAVGHEQGWDHYLERLVRLAADGAAGADEWHAMPDPIDEIAAAEAVLAPNLAVLRDLSAADLEAATPCARFNVGEVVEHLLGSLRSLGASVGLGFEATGGSAEAAVAEAADRVLEAWRARGLEGTVTLGSGELPAELAAGILSIELLVHAWDVASATGRRLEVADPLAAYVLGIAERVIAPEMRDGDSFADAVECGPDADSLTRLIAFTGRRPG